MGDAQRIARTLGGKRSGEGWICHCPVPGHGNGHGDRNPSLLVKDGDNAVLLKCFADCDKRDVLAELRRRGLLGDDVGRGHRRDHGRDRHREPDPEPEHKPDPEAIAVWGGASRAPGSIVEKYLRARKITIEPPPSLRSGGGSYLDRYQLPAMIAAVQALDRRTIAVQTTLIDPRGDRKAQVRQPRNTIAAFGLGWGAVRLGAAGDELGIAEGVEKALAAMQIFGVPCWSSLGACRMHRVWIPENVRTLHIFADNDVPGRDAAERTAHEHRQRRVALHFPPDGFKDWDDVTAAQARERSTAA